MLELIVAALLQVSVLTSGSTPVKTTTSPTNTTVQSATAPTSTTNIGTSGWDDRN
ncbi:hypothetical protein [Adhaeribacter pallidiroseus]|uniref:Uncharacterized protein n=1 Tax=Adhaeribacter pallidiroseus TaxID=2072847 RepID=A0A369QM05_9BACT|nr:hypothetical protein [Adhaeribacter pallidiroseus]RDC65380.1 hypothetical protein AHMF7616_04010 [Adhaeribacter pallidiroseus]